jgi:hypothetical protein
MQTITLSESAVAVLRFRAMRCPMKIREQDREAFRELVDAGIMKPDGASYRFTDDGLMRREDILREREEKIEREMFEPPDASNLSEDARDLLRRIVSGERIEIVAGNRNLFHELAAARIIYLRSSVARGAESAYRFTYYGWHRRLELLGCAATEKW